AEAVVLRPRVGLRPRRPPRRGLDQGAIRYRTLTFARTTCSPASIGVGADWAMSIAIAWRYIGAGGGYAKSIPPFTSSGPPSVTPSAPAAASASARALVTA